MRRFTEDVLKALGASEEEAIINADGLVTACLWWHPGQHQGLEKLFRYTRRVKNGGIVPRAKMTWIVERSSSALLDAAKGFGYVAGFRAMALAIEKARGSGIAIAGVRHSNHFGIAGYQSQYSGPTPGVSRCRAVVGTILLFSTWRSRSPGRE